MVTNPVAIMRRENARLQAENEQLQEELRNLREFVQILNDLTRATRSITSDAELLPLLDDIFTRALNLLNAPDGSLMLLDDETDEMVFVLVRGVLAANLRGYRIPASEGIAGWVIKTRSRPWCGMCAATRVFPTPLMTSSPSTRSLSPPHRSSATAGCTASSRRLTNRATSRLTIPTWRCWGCCAASPGKPWPTSNA